MRAKFERVEAMAAESLQPQRAAVARQRRVTLLFVPVNLGLIAPALYIRLKRRVF